jgi:hypothetical protein
MNRSVNAKKRTGYSYAKPPQKEKRGTILSSMETTDYQTGHGTEYSNGCIQWPKGIASEINIRLPALEVGATN